MKFLHVAVSHYEADYFVLKLLLSINPAHSALIPSMRFSRSEIPVCIQSNLHSAPHPLSSTPELLLKSPLVRCSEPLNEI